MSTELFSERRCRRSARPVWRRDAVTASAMVGLLLVAGCGIRATTVPVDAGPAPTRSSCVSSNQPFPPTVSMPPPPPAEVTAHVRIVYLVCNAQVDRVSREGTIMGTREELAQLLLAELGSKPTTEEMEDGYESSVPQSLKVIGQRSDDPERTLRLNAALDDLPPFALGQIVCTFSYALEAGRPIRIAGSGDGPVREFACTAELRTKAEAGMEEGTPL